MLAPRYPLSSCSNMCTRVRQHARKEDNCIPAMGICTCKPSCTTTVMLPPFEAVSLLSDCGMAESKASWLCSTLASKQSTSASCSRDCLQSNLCSWYFALHAQCQAETRCLFVLIALNVNACSQKTNVLRV